MPSNIFMLILELNEEKVHISLSRSQFLFPLCPKLSIAFSNYPTLESTIKYFTKWN